MIHPNHSGFLLNVVETCDVEAIPEVDDATFEQPQGTNLTLPGDVEVQYTCNSGYQLVDPTTFTTECEIKRSSKNEREFAVAVWRNTSEVICEKGQ